MTKKNVQDIYKLSPVQQGMLLHTLAAPEAGVYCDQFVLPFEQLDLDAFASAWRQLIERHTSLRTSFLWQDLDEPVQIVHRRVDFDLRVEDLRAVPAAEREARFAELRRRERERGFDLTRAPLLRVTAVRFDESRLRVIWGYHHLVMDGWSVGLILRELPQLYRAAQQGIRAELPPAPPYRSFIRWLRKQNLEEAEAYWRRRLAGLDGATPLGIDRPAGGDDPGFERLRHSLDPRLSARLKSLTKKERLTLPSLFAGAWGLVLSRYSGQRDVLFGLTVSGRPPAIPGVERIVGCFINTLPFRLQLPPHEPLRRWLKSIQEAQVELRRFEHSPLVEVHRWSGLPREGPLFDSILVFEAFGFEAAGEAAFQRTNYPLAIEVNLSAEPMVLTVSIELSRIARPAAEGLIRHLEVVLEQLAAGDAALGAITLLGEAERAQLARWNRTAVAYDQAGDCLHQLIAAQAARSPREVAVVYGDDSLTYEQLERAAERLAAHLQALGVGPDVLVGICAERSLELVVGLYAILKAGGAYVPIDPSYPPGRQAFMIEDARVPVLLVQAALRRQLPVTGAAVVELDGELPEPAPAYRPPPTLPENLAYMIYTSGSTGRPKGAMNSHRAIVNRLLWMQQAYRLSAADRVLQKTPFSFDVSVWEFFWPLMTGARLVVAKPGGHADSDYLSRLIEEQGVTVMHFVPSMLQAFLEEPALEQRCGSLRQVVASGEALPYDLQERFFARLGHVALDNLYGPTEAAVDVTYHPCVAGDARRLVPIGKPIANLRIHLFDDELRPVPVGVAGELYIAGVGLARGYGRRPGLTAERFVPDPLAEGPGERAYRSGDLARYLPDGAIHFLGRVDFQVKVRGLRIELGEIEAALAALPEVREAVVMARQDVPGDPRLVAYLTGDGIPAPAELAARLADRLPDYMVPAAFVVLERLPLNPNGKVDRKALPAPAWSREEGRRAPRTPTEEVIAGIWAEVLGLSSVDAESSFFELGGHSLLATRIASRLRRAFGVELPLGTLLEEPTVASLARAVDAARQGDDRPAAPPLTRSPRDAELPLSFAQERLWFLDQLEPGQPWYNVPTALRLRGPLELPGLAVALCRLVARHEVLRTTFAGGERPQQIIHPPGSVVPPLIDLGGLPPPAREAAAARLAGRFMRRPFDLAAGPLLRLAVLRLAEEEHGVLLAMHHIVSDEWSMGVLVRELAALYAAAHGGRPAELPELPLQYADYAAWQRRWLAGEVLDALLARWRRRLEGAPAVIDLPTDLPYPRHQSYRGAFALLPLPRPLAEALRALARRNGSTLFMTFLAAWGALLARYGRPDVVIGTPIAGRDRLELEDLIGFFVNTLVLRLQLADDPGFEQLLGRARDVALAAYADQDLPFEKLVEALAPQRSLSRPPIFQVMLVMQQAPPEPPPLPDLELEPASADAGTSKFELTLNVADDGKDLLLNLRYNRDLFLPATAERLLGQLKTLLEAAVEAPATAVSALPLLSAAERRQVLEEWARPQAAYRGAELLHQLVAEQTARTPQAVAATFGDDELTYAELERRAARLARHLQALGVGPEARVGVCLERSLELVVAVYAVLAAGGVYLPLDPSQPDERLAFMLEDAGARLVLTTAGLVERLPATGPAPLLLDRDAGAIAAQPDELPAAGATPDAAAYVIYTSGSTGRPKGVVVPHRAVANRMAWVREVDLDAGVAFLQKAPIGFDVSIAEIFAPLVCGGRVVLPPPGAEKDPDALLELIAAAGVTHTSFPPTLLSALLDDPDFARRAAGVKSVITGGETVPPELPARFHRQLPGAVIENRYGPTETTISVTSWICPPGARPRVLPIGRPIAGAEIYVVDRHFELLPAGITGEILIGGVCLARGYLGRPALTAASFIPHPFARRAGERLYASGDLGRYDAGGAVVFAGRRDDQVKIRGFRVELGEVEAALRALPGVRQAAVVDLEDGASRRLVAYLVAEAGAELDGAELAAGLGRSLPAYMVPSAFAVLDRLPLTPSGKIDRADLRRRQPPAARARRQHQAPITPVEEVVASIYAEVLEQSEVGRDGDFFALGGHSLRATQVVSRLRRALGVELPVRAIFEHPTVADLAALVAATKAEASGFAAVPIEPLPRDRPLPQSFAQERMWFLSQLEPDSPAYIIPAAIRLRGELDEAALAAAAAEILRRHEILRTTFGFDGRTPVQRPGPPPAGVVRIADLRALPAGRRQEQVTAILADHAQRPFDLARGPLVRLTLVRLADDERAAILAMHHIVSDGWSMGIFIDELAALYDAFSRRRPSPLPPLPIQYADYAAAHRRWLSGEAFEEQLAYWRQRLLPEPEPLALPADRPHPALPTFAGDSLGLSLGADLSAGLAALSRARGGTLFMSLLALYATLLHRLSGQRDVVVGTPTAGRDRVQLEGLIGCFINTLALRVDLGDDPPFAALLEQVREETLNAFAHQELPFERLIEALQPQRNLNQMPLFQALLVMQNVPRRTLELPGVTLEPLPVGTYSAKFDLTLTAVERDQQLDLQLSYKTDLFDPTTIRRFASHLKVMLAAAIDDPEAPLSALPLLSPAERQQLLVEWNDTAAAPAADLLHRRFEARADEQPEAPAVVYEDLTLSYRQLDEEANRLAHHLRDLGVGPEVMVGVWVERSAAIAVGTYGVLKAGGCYVPMDPRFPAERVALMLGDAGARVVVTHRSLAATLPPEHGFTVVCLDADREAIAARPASRPAVAVDPRNPAYAIYTSGSTGQPKGVVIEHRRITGYLSAIGRDLGWQPGSFAMVQSPAVDACKTNVHLPLSTGGCLHVLSFERAMDPRGAEDYFRTHRIDALKLAPSHLKALHGGERPQDVMPRRVLILGGEGCHQEWVDRLQRFAPACRITNHYGPTEATVTMLTYANPSPPRRPRPLMFPTGRPIDGARVHLVDRRLQPVPVGVSGEIMIAGTCLARGYLGRPAATAERFVPDPWSDRPGARMYRTGDVARRLADGVIDFLGRSDDQVKIRGFRVELGEVESAIAAHPGVRETVAMAVGDGAGGKRLAAWVVAAGDDAPTAAQLRVFLQRDLPDYMVPSAIVFVDALPRTGHGKLDRKALLSQPLPDPTAASDAYEAPGTDDERTIAGIWRQVLGVERVGVEDNFFDLGGHSLLIIQLQSRLREAGYEPTVVDLFRHPTVRTQARYLGRSTAAPQAEPLRLRRRPQRDEQGIAIIGMAGRFPGAADVETLWHNLERGIESVTFFSDQELLAAGVARELLADPRYVRARAVLAEIELFDAAFFGYTPREAQVIDPQQRLFLECAWQALEDSGYAAGRGAGDVGVFAGAAPSTYANNLAGHPALIRALGFRTLTLGNKVDYLATRVSYCLNLTGPSVNVQTACSTSLVAVHLACRSLLEGACDLALAGGVTIHAQQVSGYVAEQDGGIASPDGHTRTFDARAAGTVSGNGVGVVVLKPLAAALADGDAIRAVIRGSAINNDGALKVGFTAPSVEGQARVIAEAQAQAGVEPESIGYVEAHGTATPLGDPIEIGALTRAFRDRGARRRAFCAVGSIKSNFGHLDCAAGVAGLIKATLAVERGRIPPSLHFEQPNPQLGLDDSPFFVNAELRDWPGDGPRRAAVSSFGLGGTNAHVVLEQAPPAAAGVTPRDWQLLLLSARTPAALDAATTNLARHLEQHPEQPLADVAYTLQVGRAEMSRRRMVVARDHAGAISALRARDERVVSRSHEAGERPVVFMFPGGGAQHVGMGRELYRQEPVYAAAIDRCAELVAEHVDFDLKELTFAAGDRADEAAAELRRTSRALPVLFATEYALATLWTSWGVRPRALIGHSLGEYVAAALAGVFSLADALAIVALRGRLFETLPRGSMLGVGLDAAALEPYLGDALSIAAINTPSSCVASGPVDAIAALAERLEREGHEVSRLHIDVAAHSAMVDGILEPFAAFMRSLRLAPPEIPLIANVTGTWMRAEEATDPSYWVRHLRHTVRFGDGVGTVLDGIPGGAGGAPVLLEVGPGHTLSTLARQHPARRPEIGVLTSLPRPQEEASEQRVLAEALGKLWLHGAAIDWQAYHRRGTGDDAGPPRRRLPLPTYPFERRRYWIDPVRSATAVAADDEELPPLPEAEEPAAVDDFQAPRDELEKRVAGLWRQLLGRERIGIHDDFFELGGSSLLAVRLRSRLSEAFGLSLSPHALLEAPTVARLAALIRQQQGGKGEETSPGAPALDPCLVVVQAGDPGGPPPLFLVHPVGGHVYYYRDLAAAISRRLPVYGLRALGLEEGEEPIGRIELMAERYVAALRGVQPEGPYRLGGSSMGGMIAYEMAQQLAGAGQEVSFLGMLDTAGPGHMPERRVSDAEVVSLMVGDRLPLSLDELEPLSLDQQIERVLQEAERLSGLDFGLDPASARRMVRALKVHLEAMFAYRPQPYPGSIVFLRAAERRPRDPRHPELAWIGLAAGGVEVHVVPGDHITMHHPPHLDVVAARLAKALGLASRERRLPPAEAPVPVP
ncbi:MAG: amino acid adenylation domain-containing protein [Acidobacteria bacterium]|nr:MAG: amino acid adenylation domain-containing protein [Acidobacteriota bacterium]